MNNGIFIAKLCIYSYRIKKDWMDAADEPGNPDDSEAIYLFATTFAVMLIVIIVTIFMTLTVWPLREHLFDEIRSETKNNNFV